MREQKLFVFGYISDIRDHPFEHTNRERRVILSLNFVAQPVREFGIRIVPFHNRTSFQ